MEEQYELLKKYALNDKNYKAWRKEHTAAFGEIFSTAFEENEEAQIHLTAALIQISQRSFEDAMPKLQILESICACEYDRAVVDYFMGLDHELLGNEAEMTEHYEAVRRSGIFMAFPLPFHPYYRTAKFAQRDSECTKAIFYYQKALSFYDGAADLSPRTKSTVSQIIYDVATLFLYSHRYDECDRFLELSVSYDEKENQHRTFVTAILRAVQGKAEEARGLLGKMSAFLRANCEPTVEAILAQADPHYCVVPQDRSGYGAFWSELLRQKSSLEALVHGGELQNAEKILSDQLSATLSFMKRKLDCRVEAAGGTVSVLCKSYAVRSLNAEYEALFALKPQALENWSFRSANEFESY